MYNDPYVWPFYEMASTRGQSGAVPSLIPSVSQREEGKNGTKTNKTTCKDSLSKFQKQNQGGDEFFEFLIFYFILLFYGHEFWEFNLACIA